MAELTAWQLLGEGALFSQPGVDLYVHSVQSDRNSEDTD